MPMSISQQVFWLLILALPVACISRTVVFEEVFREPREWLAARSKSARSIWVRKLCYLFTCEYCFSHYVALFFLLLTRFKLLIDDWRGYIISFFTLVIVANVYLSVYAMIKVDITQTKVETEKIKQEVEEEKESSASGG
jgi:hypothetical protein